MTWTTQPPTRPGFYYWQDGRVLHGDRAAIVQVVGFRDKTREPEATRLLLAKGEPLNIAGLPECGPVSSFGGRWAGPLPGPSYL